MRKTLAKWFGRRGETRRVTTRPVADPKVESALLRMPKVELQVALENCLRPARILSLASKHGLEMPFESEADVRKLLRFSGFDQRAKVQRLLGRALRDAEDIHLLALDFVAEQAMQNVLYSEVHVDVATYLGRGIDGDGLRRALTGAANDAEKRHGIRLKVIAAIHSASGVEVADQVLDWALADPDGLVAGVGLVDDGSGVLGDLVKHCKAAAAAGLGRSVVIGESAEPDEIRRVLDIFDPQRLGRGLRASEDPDLVAALAEQGTAILACPSADVRCGLYDDVGELPLTALQSAGVGVSIHSDGGPLYDTNLTREYVRLHLASGWPLARLRELAASAVDAAFLASAEKASLTEEIGA